MQFSTWLLNITDHLQPICCIWFEVARYDKSEEPLLSGQGKLQSFRLHGFNFLKILKVSTLQPFSMAMT